MPVYDCLKVRSSSQPPKDGVVDQSRGGQIEILYRDM